LSRNVTVSDLANAAQSTFTVSSGTSVNAYTEVTVTLTAKDSGGTAVGTGGDLFYIQITNECTKASDFE